MEIKVTVSLSEEDRKVLKGVVDAFNSVKVTVEDEAPTPKKSRSKKAKVEEPEEIEETVEEDTDVEDLSDDEEIESDEETSDDFDEETVEDDEPAKVDPKQLEQLKKALNSYSAKNGKDKAVKILHKYAKVSQDVKAEDFSKLMKALKV